MVTLPVDDTAATAELDVFKLKSLQL